MAEESYNFTTARTRLEEIVTQVRKKDTSLEKSLDLLEEGVRLANACTELIDRADWVAAGDGGGDGSEAAGIAAAAVPGVQGDGAAGDIAAREGEGDEVVEGEHGADEVAEQERDDDDADDPVGEDRALEYDLAPDEDPAEER